jgi:hypothetical protein
MTACPSPPRRAGFARDLSGLSSGRRAWLILAVAVLLVV